MEVQEQYQGPGMFLEACKSASESGYNSIAYEFVCRAFALYEDMAKYKPKSSEESSPKKNI